MGQIVAVRDRVSALLHGQQQECREEVVGPETADLQESREEACEDAQESREDAPVSNNMQGKDNDEVTIEAEYETVLEKDFILTARDDKKIESEESSQKSDSMHESKSLQNEEEQRTADLVLMPMRTIDEEMSQYGFEVEYGVEYGRSATPFSNAQADVASI